MNPKKSLGQHWLFDEASLEAMVRAGEVSADDVVLEVGPGLGTLTKKLCQKAKKVIAVELDDTLALSLADKVKAPNLAVVHRSILEFNTAQLPKGYKVIANIPYYLTSNLIRRLLEAPHQPSKMVLLIQKEVAERIVAQPGDMSILSVSVQYYAETALHQKVSADLFTPPPKVDSQIISISTRAQRLYSDINDELFFKIVKAGFSEKRKKLRSSFSGALQLSKTSVDEWLARAHVSSDARAQELSLKDWHSLAKSVIL